MLLHKGVCTKDSGWTVAGVAREPEKSGEGGLLHGSATPKPRGRRAKCGFMEGVKMNIKLGGNNALHQR